MVARGSGGSNTGVLVLTAALLTASAPTLAQQPAPEDAPELSLAERAVWEMEEAYWRYVRAGDVESYRDLWHDEFVGWPCFSESPVGKQGVGTWVEAIRDNGWTLTYELRPEAVRLFGDVAVVHYAAEYVYDYRDGTTEGEDEWRKFTHTWMRVDDRWRIIGGMCADRAPVRRLRQ